MTRLEEMARRMDASVEAMICAQERDQVEAMLVKLSHSLILKLDDRDKEIVWLRSEISALRERLTVESVT